MNRHICNFLAAAAFISAAQAHAAAHFEGTLVLMDMVPPDGRHFTLQQPYSFVDAQGRHWDVPAGAEIDGASIPRAFWTLAGGPFEGLYRNASVIHDWYCSRRTRPWRDVDRMFYDAMIASGVSELQAKVMYYAVVYGGPRWDDQDMHNTLLSPAEREEAANDGLQNRAAHIGDEADYADPTGGGAEGHQQTPPGDLAAATTVIQQNDLSLDQIDQLAEAGQAQ